MDVAAYLRRIGYEGSVEPNLATLKSLHRAHLYAVPFENLDISAHRPIRLGVQELFDKIVSRRRGGFCYELNGVFAALLRELGFQVTLLSARVARKDGSASPEFDHLALRVALEQPWLADVGFGDSFIEPLRLESGFEDLQGGFEYRVVCAEELWTMMRRSTGGEWERQYLFTLIPRQLSDFTEMCRYHQTSPASHFTQAQLCSMATADGRITVADMRFIETRGGNRDERVLADEREYRELLRDRFGVVVEGVRSVPPLRGS